MELRKEQRELIQYGAESSGESDSCSARPEIPRIVRKPNVHFPVHRRLSLFPALTQVNSVHTAIPTLVQAVQSNIYKQKPEKRENGRSWVTLPRSNIKIDVWIDR